MELLIAVTIIAGIVLAMIGEVTNKRDIRKDIYDR